MQSNERYGDRIVANWHWGAAKQHVSRENWTVARTQLYMRRRRMRKDLTKAVSALKPLWGKMLTACKDAKVVQCHRSNRMRTGREMSETKWGCRWVGRQKTQCS